jgi:hypothetical protein
MKPDGLLALRSGAALAIAAWITLSPGNPRVLAEGGLQSQASEPAQAPTERPTVTVINVRDVPDPVMQMSQQLPPSRMPAIPATSGAWAVEVVTGGGLMGLTKRTAVDSGGALACPASCVAPVRRQLDALAAAVKDAEGLQWTQARSDICRDCMVYRVSIWVRNDDGSIRSRSASWDSVSLGQVPAEVRQLHEQVLALTTR